MKVLHVMGRFAASGTERQLLGTMKAAVAEGLWEPTLCVLRGGDTFLEDVRSAGIRVVELGEGADWDPRRLVTLRRLIRSGDFDVVHSSLWGANVFTRLALLMTRRPPLVLSERRVEWFRSRLQHSIDLALRSRSAAYIGNSAAVVDFVLRYHDVPASRVVQVSNGIDRRIFYPLDDGSRGEARSKRRVGAVGRLIPLKGFDTLIDAVPLVLESVDAEFIIAGQGPEGPVLAQRSAGLPVHFVGHLATPQAVADFLRSLDVFVLPSHAEGLPNAVLEALACGIPAVVTEAPGMAEAVPDAPRVPAKDPKALADAIVSELRAPKRAIKSSTPGFVEVARQHQNVFEMARQLV